MGLTDPSDLRQLGQRGSSVEPHSFDSGESHMRDSRYVWAEWFSGREYQEPERLDLIFGGPDNWQLSDDSLTSTERWREWLETYRDAILRAGHSFALTFEVMPRTGKTRGGTVFTQSHC